MFLLTKSHTCLSVAHCVVNILPHPPQRKRPTKRKLCLLLTSHGFFLADKTFYAASNNFEETERRKAVYKMRSEAEHACRRVASGSIYEIRSFAPKRISDSGIIPRRVTKC